MKDEKVIECGLNGKTAIARDAREDFDTSMSVNVAEGAEAVFVLNGVPEDSFGVGKHLLSAETMPKVNRHLRFPTGQVSPFYADLYTVVTSCQDHIAWGGDPIGYLEPFYDFYVSLSLKGEFGFRIADSRKFLANFMKKTEVYALDALHSHFRVYVENGFKSFLVSSIKEDGICVYKLEKEIGEVAERYKPALSEELSAYGIEVTGFSVKKVECGEDDDFIRHQAEFLAGVFPEKKKDAQGVDEIPSGGKGEKPRRTQMVFNVNADATRGKSGGGEKD